MKLQPSVSALRPAYSMRCAVLAFLTVTLLLKGAHAQVNAAAPSAPCGQTTQIPALLEEVRSLRVLITTWILAAHSERTRSIEQSIEALRLEKARLQQEEHNAQQQLATTEAQIRSVAVGSEQHLQLEADKALITSDTSAYRQQFRELAMREADLQQEMAAELKRAAMLNGQLKSTETLLH